MKQLLLLFLLSTTLFAGPVAIELQPRLQMSKFGGKEAREYEESVQKSFHPVAGFAVGFGLPIKKSDLITLVPEIRLNRFGSHYTINDTITEWGQKVDVEGEFTDDVYFLEVPLLCRFTFPLEKTTPYINTGAYFGVRLAQNRTGYSNYYYFDGSQSKHEVYNNLAMDSAYAPISGGLVVGGGVMIDVIGGYLLFDFRYDAGIIPITIYKDVTVRTTNLSFTIGYGFGIKKP